MRGIKTRSTVLLLILASVAAPLSAQTPDLLERIGSHLPDLSITLLDREVERPGPYPVTYFGYSSNSADWPYGTGFVVRHPQTDSILWTHLEHGDYPPHPLHWADFDADGREDLFFLAGFEEVSQTVVFVNRVATDRYSPGHFILRMRNNDVYGTVLDLDGNGVPEILLPEPRPYGDSPGPYCDPTSGRDDLARAWSEEYERLSGPFRHMTFRNYQRTALWPLDEIRIVSLSGPRYWAASEHPGHLRWRIARLREAAETASAECAPVFDAAIAYLQTQFE